MSESVSDVAVVIVTWNVREMALEALRSLYDDLDTSGLQAEVYVVDNASSDGTPDAIRTRFPQVNLTASAENLGFVRGNNLALRQAGFDDPTRADVPRTAYLLNPDTITRPGATRALYESVMSLPSAGLVGASLTYEDGSFQHGAFAFPGLRQLWAELFPTPGRFIEGRFNGRYPQELYRGSQPFEVDFTLGATMFLKREAIQQVGLMDEGFFMYCEEIDWAWRIKQARYRVYSVPSAHVVHLAGKSTAQVRPQSLLHLWTSRLRLFAKHYPAWKFALARRMVAAGMVRRARAESVPELRVVYEQIQRMADAAQRLSS